jgi:hypothetical protein
VTITLDRIEPGRYVVLETRGLARYPTPLLVVRKRQTRASKAWGHYHGRVVTETYWGVEFDGKTTLAAIDAYKKEHIPDWDFRFGRYGDVCDTLAEVKQRLEEVLGGTRAGAPNGETAAAHHGGEPGTGAGARRGGSR